MSAILQQTLKALLALVFALATPAVAAAENFPKEMTGDTREVRQKNSPKWIEAVGRIELKWVEKREKIGNKKFTHWNGKNCSISLVNLDYKSSNAGITAAHCVFSHRFIKYPISEADLSLLRQIQPEYELDKELSVMTNSPEIRPESVDLQQRVVFKTNDGKIVERKIKKIHYMKYSSSPRRDIAVVEFDRAISHQEISPLIYRTADIQAVEYKRSVEDGWKNEDTGKWIYEPEPWLEAVDYSYSAQFGVAGYSADTGRGEKGQVLTYNWPCEKVSNGVSSVPYFENCYTYQGASGGAVIVKAKVGLSWCFNDDVDESAEVPKWYVLLDSVKECEEPEHWNEIIIKGEPVGYLPKNKPIIFHIGSIKGGRDDNEPEFTYWAPNSVAHKEILDALASIYQY